MEKAAAAAATFHFELNSGQMDRQTDKQVENQMDSGWTDGHRKNQSWRGWMTQGNFFPLSGFSVV